MLDTLKRVDCSLMFRAHGVFSLACILKHRAHSQTSGDVAETNSLIEKVLQVLEVHLLCVGLVNDAAAPHEYPLLLVTLQRLINVVVPTILEVDPSSPHMENIVKMWNVIRQSCNVAALQQECADFLLAIDGFPVKAIDPKEAALFVKESLQNPSRTTTQHLRTAVACVRSLVLQNSAAVKEVGRYLPQSNYCVIFDVDRSAWTWSCFLSWIGASPRLSRHAHRHTGALNFGPESIP